MLFSINPEETICQICIRLVFYTRRLRRKSLCNEGEHGTISSGFNNSINIGKWMWMIFYSLQVLFPFSHNKGHYEEFRGFFLCFHYEYARWLRVILFWLEFKLLLQCEISYSWCGVFFAKQWYEIDGSKVNNSYWG